MPTSLTCAISSSTDELDAEAGNRLELVERAAGVAEAAAGHLPERDAARGDDRADRERRLVPNAARRVLVDDLAAERAVQVDRLAAPDHRVRQRERLRRGQAAEADGHQERGHLVVGHLAARVAEDELAQLVRRELLPAPLPLDQLGRADHGAQTKTTTWRVQVSRLVEARQTRGELGSSRRRRDEVARGLVVAERDRAMDVSPFHGAEMAPQRGFPFSALKSPDCAPTLADELPELARSSVRCSSPRRAGRQCEARVGPRGARDRDRPRGRASRPRRRSRRSRRRRADPGRRRDRLHPARSGQLDHPLRLVERDHLAAELVRHPLCELAPAAADLEHMLGVALGDGGERDVIRIRPSGGGLDGHPRREPALVRVLPSNEIRVVELLHGSTIGVPDRRRDGGLAAEPEVHRRANVAELTFVDVARRVLAVRRSRAASRTRASGRSTQSSGRCRGPR